MNELRDMFQDMAALLEMQGENILSIDKNMDSKIMSIRVSLTWIRPRGRRKAQTDVLLFDHRPRGSHCHYHSNSRDVSNNA